MQRASSRAYGVLISANNKVEVEGHLDVSRFRRVCLCFGAISQPLSVGSDHGPYSVVHPSAITVAVGAVAIPVDFRQKCFTNRPAGVPAQPGQARFPGYAPFWEPRTSRSGDTEKPTHE